MALMEFSLKNKADAWGNMLKIFTEIALWFSRMRANRILFWHSMIFKNLFLSLSSHSNWFLTQTIFLHLSLSKNPNSTLSLLSFKHDKIRYFRLHCISIAINFCLYFVTCMIELCTSTSKLIEICIILLNQVVDCLNCGCYWCN